MFPCTHSFSSLKPPASLQQQRQCAPAFFSFFRYMLAPFMLLRSPPWGICKNSFSASSVQCPQHRAHAAAVAERALPFRRQCCHRRLQTHILSHLHFRAKTQQGRDDFAAAAPLQQQPMRNSSRFRFNFPIVSRGPIWCFFDAMLGVGCSACLLAACCFCCCLLIAAAAATRCLLLLLMPALPVAAHALYPNSLRFNQSIKQHTPSPQPQHDVSLGRAAADGCRRQSAQPLARNQQL